MNSLGNKCRMPYIMWDRVSVCIFVKFVCKQKVPNILCVSNTNTLHAMWKHSHLICMVNGYFYCVCAIHWKYKKILFSSFVHSPRRKRCHIDCMGFFFFTDSARGQLYYVKLSLTLCDFFFCFLLCLRNICFVCNYKCRQRCAAIGFGSWVLFCAYRCSYGLDIVVVV